MSSHFRIATLLTCHNRRETTIFCLDSLFKCNLPQGYCTDVYLVDDGSTDGTDQAVRQFYPQVIVITGDGNLFWNGGMRVAFDAALEKDYDYYLWLNDDTLLYQPAILTLIDTSEKLTASIRNSVIVVGSTQDIKTKILTYGGVVRPTRWKPTSFELVTSVDVPVECETMNGNCVLIPRQIAKAIGGMEPAFAHAMGDTDYGLRARIAGFAVWVMPGFAGTCARNPPSGTFNDTSLPMSVRWKKIRHPKGLPLASWGVYTRRHAGYFWPIFWLWPYLKVVISGLVRK